MTKWKWRLLSDEKGKWRNILISKYGVEYSCSKINLKYQSRWWRVYVKSTERMKKRVGLEEQ